MLRRPCMLSARVLWKEGRLPTGLNSHQPSSLKYYILPFYFSTAKPLMFKLYEYEWKAVVALYTFELITQFPQSKYCQKFLSIREHIEDTQLFNEYILQKVKEKTGLIYSSIQQLGLSQSTVDSVTSAFKINQGISIPPNVWKLQERFNQAQQKFKKTVLNPQIHSGRILQNLISQTTGRVISGEKGIGKSFTYLLYSYISSFIVQCRIRRYFFSKGQRLYEIVQKQKIDAFPYLIYFPLKQSVEQDKIVDSFRQQIPFKCQMPQNYLLKKVDAAEILKFTYQHIKTIKRHLKYIQEKPICMDRPKGIKLMFVGDEANYFFSQARDMTKKLQIPQDKETQKLAYIMKINGQNHMPFKLKRYSDFLESVNSYCFTVLNSSQHVQLAIIRAWNKMYRPKLFDIHQHQASPTHNIHINYTNFLLTQSGNIQLYMVFWFQIEKKLSSIFQIKKINSQTQKVIRKKLKELFIITFNLTINKERQQQHKKQSIKWRIDVRPLNIRNIVSLANFNDNLQLASFTQNSVNQIAAQKAKKFFITIKQKIQNDRASEIPNNTFECYLNKGETLDKRAFRFQILSNLYSQVLDVDPATKQINVTFSYKKIMEKWDPLFYNVAYLQMEKLAQNLGFGATDHINKTITFMLSPFVMRSMLLFLATVKEQFGPYFEIISFGGIHSDLAGHLLDRLYFYLFRKGLFNFKFTTFRYSSNKSTGKSEIIQSYERYQVIKTISLKQQQKFKDSFQFNTSLSNLIESALQSPNKSILGYISSPNPIYVQKQLQKEINQIFNQSEIYRSKNGFFDFCLVTYRKQQQNLLIQLIDNTIGNVESKIARAHKKKDEVLQKIKNAKNKRYSLAVQFIALAPSLNVNTYFSTKEKKQSLEQKTTNIQDKTSYQILLASFNEHSLKQHFDLGNIQQLARQKIIQSCFHLTLKGLQHYNEILQQIKAREREQKK